MRLSRLSRFAPALVALLVALFAPAAAHAATPETILSDLAADHTHSWVDNGKSSADLLATYKAGGRLYITCAPVSEIGRELLVEAGYRARVVGTITLDAYDYSTDGHALLEVFDAGHWQLYDVDGNARAVDAAGHGVGLVDQVAAVQAGSAHWQPIATDPLYLATEPDPAMLAVDKQWFGDITATYKRVLGVALLPASPDGRGGVMYFHDASQQARIHAYVGDLWRPATDEQWRTLATASVPADAPAAQPVSPVLDAAPAPAADAPTPAAPAAAPAAPVAAPAAVATSAPVSAVAPKHAPRKRFATKIRHRKVFHVYGSGRKARWVYVRRARTAA